MDYKCHKQDRDYSFKEGCSKKGLIVYFWTQNTECEGDAAIEIYFEFGKCKRVGRQYLKVTPKASLIYEAHD